MPQTVFMRNWRPMELTRLRWRIRIALDILLKLDGGTRMSWAAASPTAQVSYDYREVNLV
jgi:hypothetical protein